MIRRLMRIGNSVGVTLDKKMLHRLNIDGDAYLWVEADIKNKRIVVRKRQKDEW